MNQSYYCTELLLGDCFPVTRKFIIQLLSVPDKCVMLIRRIVFLDYCTRQKLVSPEHGLLALQNSSKRISTGKLRTNPNIHVVKSGLIADLMMISQMISTRVL